MAKQTKPRLILWIDPKDFKGDTHGESQLVKLDILRVDPNDDKPRNCTRNYADDGTAMFADLKLGCHVSWMSGKFSVSFMGPQYDGYMILDSAADIKAISDGWKRCMKARESFPIEPTTFGQYCGLMCAALGVREYAVETSRRGSGFYSDSTWEYGPIAKAAALVDAEIENIRKRVMPEPVQEVA